MALMDRLTPEQREAAEGIATAEEALAFAKDYSPCVLPDCGSLLFDSYSKARHDPHSLNPPR